MADPAIVDKIKRYLQSLPSYGIHARGAVLFGSFARGDANEWSDIDLVVIAPEFDEVCELSLVEQLWVARMATDIRIEPIPCGEREWEADTGSPILEIARCEGLLIAA